MPACSHLDTINPDVALGPADACPECVAIGSGWVHLRRCLTCGHIGCCDSSPNRHARAHYESTQHPVVASAQPGEDWMWCFADNVYLEP